MSAIAILSAAGVAAIVIGTNADIQTKALDANQFIHYKGLAATCEQDGVTDYYTNCYDATYTELPEGATVVQERQATAADIEYIAEHDEEDVRLIHAEGHNFDGATGECVHVKNEKLTTEIFDLYENHGTFQIVGDSGTMSDGCMVHPSAGGNTPGIIRAVQTAEGNWTVTSEGFNFYKSGSQIKTFNLTNRSTMRELFTSDGSWGVTSVTIGDVILTK